MSEHSIYKDIAERTGGDIYIGVVGPVRSGKSTFITRFMQELVLPNMAADAARERARDEMPQSAAGRTVMTTEPKFIPEEAAEISPDGKTKLRIRMIDSVGYMVAGATGAEEDGVPRMVTTPWYDHEIPFNMAAEIGTRKVITEHSTIGLVITTDASISEIPREEYEEAEARVIEELKEINKPFIFKQGLDERLLTEEKIKEIASFYDYLQIHPLEYYVYYVINDVVDSDEEIISAIKKLFL